MINELRPMIVQFQKKYYKFITSSVKLEYEPPQNWSSQSVYPMRLTTPSAQFSGYFVELTEQEIAEFMLEKL